MHRLMLAANTSRPASSRKALRCVEAVLGPWADRPLPVCMGSGELPLGLFTNRCMEADDGVMAWRPKSQQQPQLCPAPGCWQCDAPNQRGPASLSPWIARQRRNLLYRGGRVITGYKLQQQRMMTLIKVQRCGAHQSTRAASARLLRRAHAPRMVPDGMVA
jgi:hypothetical protein